MVNKNLLWASALIGMMVLGTATTIVVSNEAEARDVLERTMIAPVPQCEILGVDKTVASIGEIATQPTTVNAVLSWAEGQRVFFSIQSVSADKATIQAVVAAECNSRWIEIQPTIVPEQITVQIKYNDQNVVGTIYDITARRWKERTATMIG